MICFGHGGMNPTVTDVEKNGYPNVKKMYFEHGGTPAVTDVEKN